MIINLDKLNNSNNLKDGHPRNTLFTHYVFGSEDVRCFEPATPSTRNLKVARLFP